MIKHELCFCFANHRTQLFQAGFFDWHFINGKHGDYDSEIS